MTKSSTVFTIALLESCLLFCASPDERKIDPLDHMATIAAVMIMPIPPYTFAKSMHLQAIYNLSFELIKTSPNTPKHLITIKPSASPNSEHSKKKIVHIDPQICQKKEIYELLDIAQTPAVATFSTYETIGSKGFTVSLFHHESETKSHRHIRPRQGKQATVSILIAPHIGKTYQYILSPKKVTMSSEYYPAKNYMDAPFPNHGILIESSNELDDDRSKTVKIWAIPPK